MHRLYLFKITLLSLVALVAIGLAGYSYLEGANPDSESPSALLEQASDEFDFPSLVSSTRFEEQGAWTDGFRLAKIDGVGVVVGPGTDNKNVFAQRFAVESGAEYIVIARAASVRNNGAEGKFQINWVDKSGKFLSVSQNVFRVGPTESIFHFRATAPNSAAYGGLYVGPGNMVDAVRYTEMRIGLAVDAEKYFPKPGIISSPRFDSQDKWSEGFKLARLDGGGVMVGPGTDNPNVFSQAFPVKSGDQFRVVARATSTNGGVGIAKTQINWVDANGKFISASQRMFEATPKERVFVTRIVAPFGAALGGLYVVPGGASERIKYSEMSLTKLDLISDFGYFRIGGIEIREWLVVIALVLLGLVARSMTIDTSISKARTVVLLSFFALAIALVALSFIALEVPYEMHFDSRWHQGQAEAIMAWNSFSIDLGASPLYNFGIQLPINPLLSPTYWIGSFSAADHRIQVQGGFQAVVFLLLFASVSRLAGARWTDATAIGTISALLMCYPSLSGDAITADAVLGLLWQDASIATLIAATCFALIGDTTLPKKARYLPPLGFGATIFWFFLAYPELVPFFAIALSGLCLGAIFGSADRFERIQKVATGLVILGLILAFGLHRYITVLFAYTPQSTFGTLIPDGLWKSLFENNTSVLTYAGLGGWRIFAFFALSIIGAFAAYRNGNRFARKVVVIALTFEVSVFLLSALNAYFRFLVISFYYIELIGFAVVVFLAGVATWAIARSIEGLHRLTKSSSIKVGLQLFPFIALIWIPFLVITRDFQDGPGVSRLWPPKTNVAPVTTIVERLRVSPGDTFRGRLAVIVGTEQEGRGSWKGFENVLNGSFRRTLGNDLFNDLAASGVPLANEYGHWTSPATLAMQCAALCRPEDIVLKAAHATRAYNPSLARLMGISIIVTDMVLPKEREIYNSVSSHYDKRLQLFVYQLDDANLGQYSPTNTIVVSSARQILDALQSKQFDGRNTAVVEKALTSNLSPIKHSIVRLLKGPTLEIEAVSDGVSLIVLPFEFSHCLEVTGRGFREVVPVNLAQTGVIVEGDAKLEIRYRFGPWKGTECRRQDVERTKRLKLKGGAVGRVFSTLG